MNSSHYRDITDELLSAYLDDQVTPPERTRIEAAVAADGELAWRLESLRQTVALLQALPEIALPRSFALPPLPVNAGIAARPAPTVWARGWDGWRSFWQAGNPLLRNAAAVSFVVMVALLGGNGLLSSSAATRPESASASAAEAVALAPPAAKIAAPPASTEVTADAALAGGAADTGSGEAVAADAAPSPTATPTAVSTAAAESTPVMAAAAAMPAA